MRVRDPEGKKRDLLDAALTEFARAGLGGAKIEAIAKRAGCSGGLVYTHFGSKEALFDAVLDEVTAKVVAQTPITPDDLPGYAVRLFDSLVENPEVERFAAWYALERGASSIGTPVLDGAMRHKLDEIAEGQRAGRLNATLEPLALIAAVQAIARMWFSQPLGAASAPVDSRRTAIYEAVRSLVTPRKIDGE